MADSRVPHFSPLLQELGGSGAPFLARFLREKWEGELT
jgi:hypothetical protein